MIYFLRHGQTNWNKAGRWQGQSEVPLNEMGLAQSQAVADKLLSQDVKPACVVSSPRGRAKQTAYKVAQTLGVEVNVELAFAELNLGKYEGQLTQDLERTQDERFSSWLASHHRLPAPGGGESLEDGVNRARAQLAYWINYADGKDVVIVAHQAINICLKVILAGQSVFGVDDAQIKKFKQANAQIDVWSGAPHQFIRRIEAM